MINAILVTLRVRQSLMGETPKTALAHHRPDLKQFIVDLISSADGDIPIFLKSASGNQSDSSSFAKIFLEYQEQIQKSEIKNENNLMVADAALYNAKNINS